MKTAKTRPKCAMCEAETMTLVMRPNTGFWLCVDCDRATPLLQETQIVLGAS